MMDEISEATQGGAVLENTGDNAIFIKAIHRAVGMGVNAANLDEVVIFLEKEIDGYRDKIEAIQTALNEKCDKIKCLENRNATQAQTIKNQEKERNEQIKELKTRLNAIYGTSQLEAVQENTGAEIIKALSDNGYNISINLFKDNESEES